MTTKYVPVSHAELHEKEWLAAMSGDEQAAFNYARHHHDGQVRKYTDTGEPYIYHPLSVANIVRSVPHDTFMIQAALMHDCIEGTNATYADILWRFGQKVADLVLELTDVSTAHDGLRQHRKSVDRAHTARASASAQTVKLADLLDNTASIVENAPGFAPVYMQEKEALLDVLRLGDRTLWVLAWSRIQLYKEKNP